ncbi:MAG: DNA-3-methyladenine glycosylase I [Spirochaetales bacterium]|nr:DNA-3-methyladenine glycosylase I [Spirochaetales bacterium]
MERCPWCGNDPLMVTYHDTEWGTPLHDEQRHFEFLLLECMQAGLSWSTILKKRENFREAFDGFDYHKVAVYREEKILELLNNAGIIRYRLKIEAAINNANRFMAIQKEFGSFDKYIWGFTGGKPVDNGLKTSEEMPVISDLSDEISKDLKKRGFKFVGSTTIYAHLQAIGVINDHLVNCPRYEEVQKG